MAIFDVPDYSVTISAAFAKQRFMCSPEYSAGVCHGGCCAGPSIVPLSENEAIELLQYEPTLPVCGRVLFIRGKKCPLSLPNGHCKFHGTTLKSFACTIAPFCLSVHGKLILDNGFMRRACRVRNNVNGGLPAYVVFDKALTSIFGDLQYPAIKRHFDNGGGDIAVPIDRDKLDRLYWLRGIVNDVRKHGYSETVYKLSGGKQCL